MNYSAITIGERIKTARCNPFNGSSGYSQGNLAVALGLDFTSRTTIRKWERGEVLPPLEHLLKMCELFGCELGYLLGEYDLPTKAATDIQAETGLSENAINWLHSVNCTNPNLPSTLSFLIEQPFFAGFLLQIEKYLSACRAEVIYDNLHNSLIPHNLDSLDLVSQGKIWSKFANEIKRIVTTRQYDDVTSNYLLTYISIFSMEDKPADMPVSILTDEAALEPKDIQEFIANKAFSALLKEALENIVKETR